MPIFEYECPNCKESREVLCVSGSVSFEKNCPDCAEKMEKVPSACTVVIAGNIGAKLGNRIELDTELKRMGMSTPLFKNEEAKDYASWAWKKRKDL